MNFNSFAKKVFAAWMVIFFIGTPIVGARIAYAQNSTIADAPRFLEWIKNAVTDFITSTMQAAVTTAIINGLSYAADRLAYDAAVKIATGGAAEEPLYDGTPSGTYLEELARGFAGEAIGTLSDEIQGAGGILSNFDLCAPSTPYIMLQLKLGIKGVFDRPEPKCDFNKMFGPEGTWTSFVADLEGYADPIKSQTILAELANMYDPSKSEFGVGLQVSTDIFGEATFLPFIGVQEKVQNGGFQAVTDFITGNEETPAYILQQQVLKAQQESGDTRKQATLAMLGNKELILQIGVHAASVFTNTLVSKLQERIWQGMFDFQTTQVDPFDPDSFALDTTADAAERYRSLLAVAPLQIANYSILSEFITCPGSETRGLYNCVADANFVSAVARDEAGIPLTIADAIDEGLIDGSWPLIPASDVARNQDAFCYTYGFCYGNLVKLRKARVISIGWELAANASANSAESPVTLQEVLDGFNSCGSDGLPDDNHPWCKMIDPDWVLKYPDTQCRMQANGELLLTDQADERAQTCVDMPSCIGEDENGNCTGGYGYCVAEENTWKFRGESCPEYAASCLTFENSEGDSKSLLRNTVDPGPCTEDSVGCQWYASTKEEQEDGSYAYAAISDIAAADAGSETYASRIYFNAQAEECDEADGGCATLIERTTDLRLNTVFNPSFEIDEDTDGKPDGWYTYHLLGSSWDPEISTDGAYAREGDIAVSPGESSVGRGAIYQPGIELGQARTYTLSFYARQLADGGIDTETAVLDLHDENGDAIDISGLAITGDCDDSYTNIFGATVSTGVGIEAVVPADSEYQRFECTFTVPPLTDTSLRVFGDLYFLNFDGYIDSIQLEQGEDASIATSGYSATDYTTTVVKVAPAYLGCTGSADDPEECANYAQVCSEQDMGCTLYTPSNGDPNISGIATELDECPSECAGYDTYRQEATLYEPDGVDSVYFIPDTATECSAEEVGCDEFTNLNTETQEYYSFMRACVTETQAAANVSSDNGATYYTWEGSDENGYQLRTWTLLESNLGSSDYTQIGTDGATDTAPDQAPCSNWVTNNDGISCADSEDADGDGYYDWDTEDCNTRADIFTNANCREFYDENGNIHYRDWENTVTVNNDCQSYRKTTIAGDSAAEKEATCEDSGGYYVSDSGECRYYGYSEESTSCDESANGCREYAGGRSRNSRLVFEELFEDGTLNQWDAASAADATYSNESLAADGHSMLLTGPVTSFTAGDGSICTDTSGCTESAVSFGGECTIAEDAAYCGTLNDELYAGKTYTVSVVAKGTGTLQLGFDFEADPSAPEIDVAFDNAVELENGWQVLTLGPLIMDAADYPLFGEGTSLVLIPTGTAYVDNVVLREGEENLTVIRDSWVTPASCDESVTGDASPQYYLGCQEYTTQDGDTAYLKSLSSLCDEDKVGCDAFFKTQESDSIAAQTMHATCSNVDADGDGNPDTATSATACYYFYSSTAAFDTDSPYLCTISSGESSCLFSADGFTPSWLIGTDVAVSYGPEAAIVPADQDMFLVVTDEVTCDTDAAGCTEFGDPQWSQDRNSTTGADSVYLMNLPETYDDILCAHDELFCDAFTTTAADTYYFKDPGDQLCEYRTDVTVNGVVYNGWFREGTDNFCYGTCEDSGGNEGAACGSSADCNAGETCNAENPSYVIGGTESGIWKNGDSEFSNWAGTCSESYDTCTEFQDKLAQDDGEVYGETDGTSYFYLNNDSLSEYGLSDSQKCDGQVSLKNGCAMFYDTGDTSLSANASATEIASRHADTLFGSEPYGLVDPIDCENGGDTTITTSTGEEIDLCATRCVYDYGEVNDLSDGVTYQDKLTDERTSTADYDRDEMYVFGGSCYESTDCPLVRSESGADVEAISCSTQVRVDPFSVTSSFGGSFSSWKSLTLNTGFDEVPRQENDTNTTLKVNRDRSCAEWLSCSNTQTQWDEASSSFITTCGDIALCTGYDATTGTSFCSDWDFEKPDVIYDTDWYASRDTSWYGNEYSGMAIPGLFPVQSLAQADVSPDLYCVNTATSTLESGTCEVEGENCGSAMLRCLSKEDAISEGAISESDADFALVLDAGECSEDYGATCSVGYCEDTGSACATSDQCSSGSCLVGSCYEVEATTCQTADDCSEGQTCYGGACATVGDSVTIEKYDASTGTSETCTDAGLLFVEDAAMKLGSCINDRCLLTPDGEQYVNGTAEGKICRAYPEATSPFPNEIVDQWYEPANAGDALSSSDTISADALPYGTLSGFENTVTCSYGEDCDCSYTKVAFGEGIDTRYYGMDWTSADISLCSGTYPTNPEAGSVCTSDSACGGETCVSAAGQLGICQSGDRAGGYCTESSQCGENDICSKTTREDVLYGMNGFCLEKDTSINILGDRNKQACLSWLPVDELAGDTDLQAKYLSAGYFEDTSYCIDTRTYWDAVPSLATSTSVACAENSRPCYYGGTDSSYSEMWDCAENVACPDGFYAIVGQCQPEGVSMGAMTDLCAVDVTEGDDDCPYVCIPNDSYHQETGEACEAPSDDKTRDNVTSWFGTDVYLWSNSTEESTSLDSEDFLAFDAKVAEYADCVASGIEVGGADGIAESASSMPAYADGETGDDTSGYRYLSVVPKEEDYYQACKEFLQVANGDTGYAWTDRIYNEGQISDATYPNLEYWSTTNPSPFGSSSVSPTNRQEPEEPLRVAACNNASTQQSTLPIDADGDGAFDDCESDSGIYAGTGSDPTSPEARSFIDFTFDYISDTMTISPSSGATDSIFSRLAQIFAKPAASSSLLTYTWTSGIDVDRGYVSSTDNYATLADYDVRLTEGTPPTIWAVDTQSCSDDGILCEEGNEGEITLNSQSTGNQTGSQFFSATVKFYAAADKNQLPIRRVIVDWGDDLYGGSYTGSDDDDNFFKNARGLQEGTQNSKCDLGTEWGLTSESCDPYYFSYTHVYTCSSELLRDTSAACVGDGSTGDASGNFPCWMDQSGDTVPDACVYKPRVHVRDNWGFCTGTCDARGDGDLSCFDEGSIASFGLSNEDECAYNYEYMPEENNDPYVEYSGIIIVTP